MSRKDVPRRTKKNVKHLGKQVKTYQDVPRNKLENLSKMHKILVHAQDSCVCTALLCMHNTLVHALEGPGTKAGTQTKSSRGSGPGDSDGNLMGNVIPIVYSSVLDY